MHATPKSLGIAHDLQGELWEDEGTNHLDNDDDIFSCTVPIRKSLHAVTLQMLYSDQLYKEPL